MNTTVPAKPSGELNLFQPLELFRLPVDGIALQGPGARDTLGPPAITSSGDGVPAVLDYFLRRDRDRFYRTIEAFKRLVPGVEDINIATPNPERRHLEFVLSDGLCIPADSASSGVRLLLFFVVLAYHPTPPHTILLEEPETGVHPKRLAEIVELLKAVTQGRLGGFPSQVIFTTHSPYLLDLLDVKEDQVLVFRRNDDGSRSVEAADEGRLQTFLDEFKLGEVWYNQGEEGLVPRNKT
jgi:predicted ATPase